MKIGDRVKAEGHLGTIVEATEEIKELRPRLKDNPKGFWCVKFDDVGPHGDGYGIYSLMTYKIYVLPRGGRP